MDRSERRSRLLLAGSVLSGCLALAAVALPALACARAAADRGIALHDGPQPVALPAGKRYGIYVDDTDNSGYSEQCAIDDRGRSVPLHDPGWSASSSATQTLDMVFDTGSGRLTIDCSISAERYSVRPVPNVSALVIGIALGGALAGAGVVLVVLRAQRRPARTADTARAADAWPQTGSQPAPGWYPDPQLSGRSRYWSGSAWTEHVND